jgi:hypothetical protein
MIKNFIQIKIFCFIFLFHIIFGYGQEMDEIDTQSWFDFRAYYIINDDWPMMVITAYGESSPVKTGNSFTSIHQLSIT